MRTKCSAARALLLFIPALLNGATLRIGVGKQVITPNLKVHSPVYIAGYGNNRVATGIHDDLYARCMAFDSGARPLVICGADVIGIFWDDVQKIRSKVPQADLVIAALHDHEGPDTMGMWGPTQEKTGTNESYMEMLVERIAASAQNALRTMRPARIRLVSLHTPELDTFIRDSRPPDVHDSTVLALEALDQSGQPIGTLLNWANHPEALGSKNTLITADYPAGIYRRLEELLGGTAVFLNGAVGGMQSPGGAEIVDRKTGRVFHGETFERAGYIGQRVAELAAEALNKAPGTALDAFLFRERIAMIPMTNPGFQAALRMGVFAGRKQPSPEGNARAPVGYICFSQAGQARLEVALIPGELYPELSVGGIERYPGADFPEAPIERPIKDMMSAPHRMLFGLADDENGYIIPKAEWDSKKPWLQNANSQWYGEVNSLGPDAAPIIVRTFQELVASTSLK